MHLEEGDPPRFDDEETLLAREEPRGGVDEGLGIRKIACLVHGAVFHFDPDEAVVGRDEEHAARRALALKGAEPRTIAGLGFGRALERARSRKDEAKMPRATVAVQREK